MVGAEALGHLVFVVREDQVVAAAVDVDGQAQGLLDHRRAFDVPARTPRTERARPHRLAGLGRLPQHEVGRVLLVGRDVHPGAGDHVVHRAAGQLAVVGIGLDVEQHVALGLIGGVVADQPDDHGDDRFHGLSGPWLDRRRQGPQGRHVGVVGVEVAAGDDADVDALLGGLQIDLVVHVGDVGRVDHMVFAVEPPQHAEQHVEGHHRPGVADMGVIVDRRSAHIHRHPLGIVGDEHALFAGQGVVQAQGHGGMTLLHSCPIWRWTHIQKRRL